MTAKPPCRCGAPARGFGWFNPALPIGQRVYTWFCSAVCLDAFLEERERHAS